jgi:hypothetical protein
MGHLRVRISDVPGLSIAAIYTKMLVAMTL